jgi:hypothetical protein
MRPLAYSISRSVLFYVRKYGLALVLAADQFGSFASTVIAGERIIIMHPY